MTEMIPGVARALSPLVRRIVAPNPGIMTGPGTNTYLVGIDEVVVIDPGPADEGHVPDVGCVVNLHGWYPPLLRGRSTRRHSINAECGIRNGESRHQTL